MFLAAGGSAARGVASAVGRAPAIAVTTSLLRSNNGGCAAAARQAPAETAALRPLAVLAHERKGARRGRADGGPGRRDAPARRRGPVRRQEDDNNIRRFQQFGRAGGEGVKVAERLYEDFGMSSRREYSPEAADKRKILLGWLEGEVRMGPRAVADMVEQEPRILEQEAGAISARLAWLKGRLMLSDEQIRSLVHRRPSVLCRSVEDGMELKVWRPYRSRPLSRPSNLCSRGSPPTRE